MIEFGMVEAYIEEAISERIASFRGKRRVVDGGLREYAGTVADVERTMGGGYIGTDGRERWHPITLVYLENGPEYAVAMLREAAADAFEGALGERYTARFAGECILVRPGLRDIG